MTAEQIQPSVKREQSSKRWMNGWLDGWMANRWAGYCTPHLLERGNLVSAATTPRWPKAITENDAAMHFSCGRTALCSPEECPGSPGRDRSGGASAAIYDHPGSTLCFADQQKRPKGCLVP